jgi:hypothetical protein
MKAQRIRKVLWIGSLAVGAGVVGVAALVLPNKPAAAQSTAPWAEEALTRYKALKPKELLPPSVDKGDLEAVFLNEAWKDRWFPFTGPRIPAPVAAAAPTVEVEKGPTGLEAIGRVRLLLYLPPTRAGEPAQDSIVFWEFADKKSDEFAPGKFIVQQGQKERFKLVDVVRVAPGKSAWKILYEVYDDPLGKPVSSGELLHDAEPKHDPNGAIRFPKKPEPVPAAAGGAAAPAASGPAAPGRPSTVVVVGAQTPAEAGATGRLPEDFRPDIREVGPRRKRIEFGDAAYESLKGKNVEKLLEDVRTEPYSQGGVQGLSVFPQGAGSVADKFDVKRGDILISINGQPVRSRDDVIRIARALPADTALVTVELDRDGRRLTYEVDPRDPKTRRAAATIAPPR